MSQKIIASDNPTRPFTEAVPGVLDGKEDCLVSINSSGLLVLFDGTFPAIGVMVSKLQPGSTEVNVRLLGKGGTVRMIQNAAITPGARVTGVNANARVAAAATGNRSLGLKLSSFAGAAGDVIEVYDIVEIAP